MNLKEKDIDDFINANNLMVRSVENAIANWNRKALCKFLNTIVRAYNEEKKIVVSGEGNSGSIGRCFVRRGTHLKLPIWFIKDASCPSLQEGDIVIFISGTGTTSGVVNQARTAHELNTFIILITSKKRRLDEGEKFESIQNFADLIIELGGRTKQSSQSKQDYGSRQLAGNSIPMLGTQFEINALFYLMSSCFKIMKLLGKTEEDIRNEHKNIE